MNHEARKLYEGRASYDFNTSKEVFEVCVAGHVIAECEDSECADFISQSWNSDSPQVLVPPVNVAAAKLRQMDGALPATFYKDADPLLRVKRMVEIWQRAVKCANESHDALDACLDYFTQREDADFNGTVPNEAMRLKIMIEKALGLQERQCIVKITADGPMCGAHNEKIVPLNGQCPATGKQLIEPYFAGPNPVMATAPVMSRADLHSMPIGEKSPIDDAMNKLSVELAYFNEMRHLWIDAGHRGDFVVVQDRTALGFFPTYEDAFKAGSKILGVARPFLIKQIFEVDPVVFIGGACGKSV